jgi:hypothetical protein
MGFQKLLPMIEILSSWLIFGGIMEENGDQIIVQHCLSPPNRWETKVVNRSLGNLLWSIIGENPNQWDLDLIQDEFSYNSFVNTSIGKSPFQVVYGRNSMGFLDLVQLLLEDKINDDDEAFAENTQQL